MELVNVATVLVALSGATEHLAEISQDAVVAKWGEPKADAKSRARRRLLYLLIAAGVGCVLAALSKEWLGPLLLAEDDESLEWFHIGILGFLSAGGSSLWNSVLTSASAFAKLRMSRAIRSDLRTRRFLHRKGS